MKILFLGDFIYDYPEIHEDILQLSEYIKHNNLITILNLEAPLKSNKKYKKMINLFSSNKLIDVLKLLNVKAVNLANNHIMDYSEDGLIKTINALKKAKIGYFGAGINKKEALKPWILNIDDKKIAFYGFGWNMEECINAKKNKAGTAPLNFKLIEKIIQSSKDDMILTFHFGYEYEKLPQPYHLKYCRDFKKNEKVKAIIGHHPHVVQAYEKKNNIYYSLGNFYFGSMRENFEKNSHNNESSKGIGVIMDPNTWQASILKFNYTNNNTIIDNNAKIENLIDISNIPTESYQEYFLNNNNTINKRYIYKTSKLYEIMLNKTNYMRRNVKKFYLRKIKWPLGRKIKKYFKVKKEDAK